MVTGGYTGAMITGHCECGRVRYQADGPVNDFSHCHCSICRRLHGAAIVSWAGVDAAGFRVVEGDDAVQVYASSENIDRHFCRHCGSQLWGVMHTEGDQVYIALGTVDGAPELPPGYHFFVDSKAPWIEIGDDLPQHPGWPPGSPNTGPE